ncbi:MAG: hypothetical protein LBC77_00805 [Spirochaetaceae bacterium]|jgi:hypothetical protein|nr:hypothetical protein [Spirochaetaceae bacterium]
MVKKGLLVLALAALAAGGAFAQEKYDGSKKNTIFFGPVMAGYERAIIPALSVGVEAGINFFGLGTDSSFRIAPAFADGFVRWYPWKRVFFVNLGLGYQGSGMGMETDQSYGAFHIKPQIGWKIDIGEAGGWIFEIRTGFGTTLGGDQQVLTTTVPILFGRTF